MPNNTYERGKNLVERSIREDVGRLNSGVEKIDDFNRDTRASEYNLLLEIESIIDDRIYQDIEVFLERKFKTVNSMNYGRKTQEFQEVYDRVHGKLEGMQDRVDRAREWKEHERLYEEMLEVNREAAGKK